MQALTLSIIETAAQAAGLPKGRVLTASKMDNLTIPRPRLELQWLPETIARTGRKLGHVRHAEPETRTLKRELYVVSLDVAALILAESPAWLSRFEAAFLAALPRGVNDAAGNWIQIRAARATWTNEPDTRVGLDVIKVFDKAEKLLVVTFTWRVSGDEMQDMITDVTMKPTWATQGEKDHGDQNEQNG